jgi:predicted RecB family nuclease
MFNKVYTKIAEYCDEHKIKIENAKIYHWGHIEQSILSKLYEKYEDKHDWETLCLIDFCKIFQEEGILIKGVYGFGLKAVGRGMIEHGLIHVPLWEDNITDGLDAMVQAYEIYSNPDINHHDTINNLVKYSHSDVRALERIISYLRRYHVPADELSETDITDVITTVIKDEGN